MLSRSHHWRQVPDGDMALGLDTSQSICGRVVIHGRTSILGGSISVYTGIGMRYRCNNEWNAGSSSGELAPLWKRCPGHVQSEAPKRQTASP